MVDIKTGPSKIGGNPNNNFRCLRLLTKLMQNGHGTCEREKKDFFLQLTLKQIKYLF